MTKRKTDGRRNNGAPNRGLTEDSQLIRGPAELLGAMREIADRDGRVISAVWRDAAREYLEAHAKGGK